jgi:hypothetical protein
MHTQTERSLQRAIEKKPLLCRPSDRGDHADEKRPAAFAIRQVAIRQVQLKTIARRPAGRGGVNQS